MKSRWWAVGIIALLSLGALGAGLKYLEEDARRQILSGVWKNSKNQSFLNRINPFLPVAPVVNSTHQLSKEYIYAGDRLLAVEDANATAVPPTDLAVWRPSNGAWYVMGASNVMRAAVGFGLDGDRPCPGDYDGDGKTDFCVVRPDQANDKAKWFILRSSDGVLWEAHWGKDEDWDKSVQADYDGDGITDVAIINSALNSAKHTWDISKSTDLSAIDRIEFGNSSDIPTPGDFDGNGKAEVAVWRNSTKSFYKLNSDGTAQTISFVGTQSESEWQASQDPVIGDYDGDGRDDFAIRNGAVWVILKSSNGAIQITNFGVATDIAVQNDYDADGKVDIAVWRAVHVPNAGAVGDWFILNSSNGGFRAEHWGQADDYPIPVFYRR